MNPTQFKTPNAAEAAFLLRRGAAKYAGLEYNPEDHIVNLILDETSEGAIGNAMIEWDKQDSPEYLYFRTYWFTSSKIREEYRKHHSPQEAICQTTKSESSLTLQPSPVM